jgi:hypothetical protein
MLPLGSADFLPFSSLSSLSLQFTHPLTLSWGNKAWEVVADPELSERAMIIWHAVDATYLPCAFQ